MIIRVDHKGQVDIVDHNEFKRFHVETSLDVDRTQAALSAANAGSMDGESANIFIDYIRAVGKASDDATSWVTGFDEMIAFARTKSWVNDEQRTIAAHVIRAQTSQAAPPT